MCTNERDAVITIIKSILKCSKRSNNCHGSNAHAVVRSNLKGGGDQLYVLLSVTYSQLSEPLGTTR
jgi:hypothetical protein